MAFLITVLAIVACILLFSFAIFIHEFGHFLAAKLLGFQVDTFSIGFGPALWKKTGDTAKKVGGHGGMDYLMDLRWSHCIRNGLPLDMSVYDFATWSSIFELSERSVRNRSQAQDIPDFTRGAWKTTPPDKAMV